MQQRSAVDAARAYQCRESSDGVVRKLIWYQLDSDGGAEDVATQEVNECMRRTLNYVETALATDAPHFQLAQAKTVQIYMETRVIRYSFFAQCAGTHSDNTHCNLNLINELLALAQSSTTTLGCEAASRSGSSTVHSSTHCIGSTVPLLLNDSGTHAWKSSSFQPLGALRKRSP